MQDVKIVLNNLGDLSSERMVSNIVASGEKGGRVPPDSEKFAKNREKEGKKRKREKIWKKKYLEEKPKTGTGLSLYPS